MPTVLVYRSHLLPWSETFIREQVLAYRRWRGILSGRHRAGQLSLEGIELHLLAAQRPNLLARAFAKLQWKLGHPPGLRSLRGQDIQVVHAHFGPDALEAAVIAKRLGVPLLVTLHGYDIYTHREWWESGRGKAERRDYPARLLSLAQDPSVHFIAVSDNIRTQAIAYGIPAAKLTTQYIGIDLAKFTPGPVPIAQRDPQVMFVGRLVEKKGCEYLLRAMQTVQQRVPAASVSIIGDGPLRGNLEALARELGIRASFRGSMPSEEVRRAFETARVFCLPSVRAENGDAEGLGMVILEAQACAVPAVTSARGGATEAIADGVTGYAFAERDVDTLADRLVRILADDERAAAMSTAALQFVHERFDILKTTAELETLYDRFAGTAAGVSPPRPARASAT